MTDDNERSLLRSATRIISRPSHPRRMTDAGSLVCPRRAWSGCRSGIPWRVLLRRGFHGMFSHSYSPFSAAAASGANSISKKWRESEGRGEEFWAVSIARSFRVTCVSLMKIVYFLGVCAVLWRVMNFEWDIIIVSRVATWVERVIREILFNA